jgi:hypothetical protein
VEKKVKAGNFGIGVRREEKRREEKRREEKRREEKRRFNTEDAEEGHRGHREGKK